MRVRVTPQYFQGQKLSDRQKADGPKLYGMLTLTSEGGREVMKLGPPGGGDKPCPRLLWNPMLASMFNDTFSISGVERSGSGAWVLQRWYCETGSVARDPDQWRAPP
jgi:hypothetical protein